MHTTRRATLPALFREMVWIVFTLYYPLRSSSCFFSFVGAMRVSIPARYLCGLAGRQTSLSETVTLLRASKMLCRERPTRRTVPQSHDCCSVEGQSELVHSARSHASQSVRRELSSSEICGPKISIIEWPAYDLKKRFCPLLLSSANAGGSNTEIQRS
jgi:hypothetical protein